MLDIDHSEGRELDEFVHGIGKNYLLLFVECF